MALLYIVLVSFCLKVVLTAALPVSSQNTTCQFQGHTVHGDFIQGPCMFCHCSNGQASCALRDCAPPSCRFQTTQPDACCPSCATVSQCEHNGHTIQIGHTYKPDPHTTCRCPREFRDYEEFSGNKTVIADCTRS